MSTGTIEPKGRVIVRRSVGVRTASGFRFQCGTRPTPKTPIIRCVETGRMWTISWEQLIDLAIADGITLAPPTSEQDGEE
jgi:hypothetical protein